MRSWEKLFSPYRTRSGFGYSPRIWRSISASCRPAICARLSPISYFSTMESSSIGMPNWRSHREGRSRSGSAASGNFAGRVGWRRTGPHRKHIAAMHGFIQLNAWGTSATRRRLRSAEKGNAMADISLEAVAGKLNRVGYEAFFKALRQAKGAGNRNVELAHWLVHILQGERSDIALTADHFKLDRGKLMTDVTAVVNGFRKNETEMPAVSNTVMDMLDRGWHYATLFFGETQIRTGHILVGALQSRELTRALTNVSQEFGKISVDVLTAEYRKIWASSDEENLRPMDGSGLGAAGSPGASQATGSKGTTALDRFSQDLTAKAKSGDMDPILGRDDEIRQIIDVLMRRRQNNPILTGEAGVGKTAVDRKSTRLNSSHTVISPLPLHAALPIPGRQSGHRIEGHHGPRPLFPGSPRQGEIGRHGSDSRPRRRDPPDHRRADAAAAKHPDPDRRSRRRQDRR